MKSRKNWSAWLSPILLSSLYVIMALIFAKPFFKWFIALPEGDRSFLGIAMTIALAVISICFPSLEANDVDAMLVHEAAIGKIAGDQLIKLMTLGLSEQEAEEQIISGFLR